MKPIALFLATMAVIGAMAEVRTFDDTTAQAVFGAGQKTALFLFTNGNDESIVAQ
jgi:hypothetical protein